jgi:hypothetical protein
MLAFKIEIYYTIERHRKHNLVICYVLNKQLLASILICIANIFEWVKPEQN